MFALLALISLCVTVAVYSQSAPFTDAEVQQIRGYFEANIGLSGCKTGFLVAAPINTDPNYYYMWQRDAGISMNVLLNTANTSSTSDIMSKFENYVTWVGFILLFSICFFLCVLFCKYYILILQPNKIHGLCEKQNI